MQNPTFNYGDNSSEQVALEKGLQDYVSIYDVDVAVSSRVGIREFVVRNSTNTASNALTGSSKCWMVTTIASGQSSDR
jgi:hypothetical protein